MLTLVILHGSLSFFRPCPTLLGGLVCLLEFKPRRSFNADGIPESVQSGLAFLDQTLPLRA
jgi:hypothetical protein